METTWVLGVLVVLGGCASPMSAEATPAESSEVRRILEPASKALPRNVTTAKPSTPNEPALEGALGVKDKGVFSDLDTKTQIVLPSKLSRETLRVEHNLESGVLVLYDGNWPLKVYPADGSQQVRVGTTSLMLRPGDARELTPFLNSTNLRVVAKSAKSDRDNDGIPDALDVFVGAIKTVHNGANYGGGYRRIDFPGGDIPREDGVCTDVVIRAVRNAGVDIQAELQKEIKRSPKSFPMVKKRNPNIDHRRVKTLLPYFKRQWEAHTVALDDKADPLRPGDIIFMDTFPRRSGPDHIGILSNRRGPSGHLLVINNWTNGYKTSEMDLLKFVPITHRYRLP